MEIRGTRIYLFVLVLALISVAALVTPALTLAASSDSDSENIKKQIDELDAQLQKIAREYGSASTQLSTTNELIDKNNQRMSELDKEIAVDQDRLNKRVVELYKNGAASFVEAVLTSDDFMQLINRYDLMARIGASDAKVLNDVKAAKAEQERIKGELADAKKKQERLARDLRYKRSIIDLKLRKEKKVLASLSISQEMGLLKKQPMRVAVARDGEPNIRLGNFVFPVLGPHTYSNDWGAPRVGHRHQGTDVFALNGTPLVACVGGSVIATWTNGGGKTIYLDGDDGNLYVYMHCSEYEKTAGRVEAGETVAYCGMTGNASGYHLHFEIHVGGRPINPYPILQATGY